MALLFWSLRLLLLLTLALLLCFLADLMSSELLLTPAVAFAVCCTCYGAELYAKQPLFELSNQMLARISTWTQILAVSVCFWA